MSLVEVSLIGVVVAQMVLSHLRSANCENRIEKAEDDGERRAWTAIERYHAMVQTFQRESDG